MSRRFVKTIAFVMIVICLSSTAVAAGSERKVSWTDGVDYLTLIENVLTECGDDGMYAASILEEKRNQKIADTNADASPTNFCTTCVCAEAALARFRGYKMLRCKNYTEYDVWLLGSMIWVEAGDDTLSDEWKLNVGAVALNRVSSEYFPNTLHDVIYQPGQYDQSWTYEYRTPSEKCMILARRILKGEWCIDKNVVFQAGFIQGSGIYETMYSPKYGYTYLCYW